MDSLHQQDLYAVAMNSLSMLTKLNLINQFTLLNYFSIMENSSDNTFLHESHFKQIFNGIISSLKPPLGKRFTKEA